jgi:hypothetical protein
MGSRGIPFFFGEKSMDPLESMKGSKKKPEISIVKICPPKAIIEDVQVDSRNYRILKEGRVSLNGILVVVSEGRIINEKNYGPGTLDKIRRAGIPFEEEK